MIFSLEPSDVGPETNVTFAPRRPASSAIAYPIFPDEGFERKRTGSKNSRVGPAVTRTRRSLSDLADFFLGDCFFNKVHDGFGFGETPLALVAAGEGA